VALVLNTVNIIGHCLATLIAGEMDVSRDSVWSGEPERRVVGRSIDTVADAVLVDTK